MAKIDEKTTAKMLRLLSSWTVFYQKAHTYHWDLTGENFLSLHKYLETLYEESVKHTDEIAERLRQTGVKTSLTLNGASSDSVIKDENAANTPRGIVQDLLVALVQITALQTEIYNDAEEQKDYVTLDLMTQLSKWCDFSSWFLSSIIGD